MVGTPPASPPAGVSRKLADAGKVHHHGKLMRGAPGRQSPLLRAPARADKAAQHRTSLLARRRQGQLHNMQQPPPPQGTSAPPPPRPPPEMLINLPRRRAQPPAAEPRHPNNLVENKMVNPQPAPQPKRAPGQPVGQVQDPEISVGGPMTASHVKCVDPTLQLVYSALSSQPARHVAHTWLVVTLQVGHQV